MRRGVVAAGAAVALAATILAQRAAGGSGRVSVGDVSLPQPLVGASTASVYATIRNGTGTADRLVAVRSSVGAGTSLMQDVARGGVGYMTDVPSIALPPHSAVKLSPGVRHGMLRSVTGLPVGSTVTLTFEFASARPVTVAVRVSAR